MKRILTLALAAALAVAPAAYADEKDDRIAALEEQVATLEERVTALEAIFTLDAGSESTDAVFYLTNESGSTQDGSTIVIYGASPDDMLQIGMNAENMDGSLQTYIYIDGELATTEQLVDTMTSLTLTGDALAAGDHTVRAVQYAGNDEAGDITFEQTAGYRVE